ncbi:YraN family protein [Desulfovibrio sp. OttesenSCG-928-F20]|nr:YraN family protein [Desulfovibrio sp. OttesenSCG-928-F20]
MPTNVAHLRTGAAGEEAAVAFLRNLGWRIVERNWRPQGVNAGFELDIVAREDDSIVFVEVKTRRCGAAAGRAFAAGGIPVHAAFTRRKQERFLRAARLYLAQKRLWHLPCRFDYIGIELAENGRHLVEHQRHVIEAGNFVDSCHTSWQPW